ncbi:MAG: hypothetical protein ABW128_16985 [Rhizorhabdus sp.]
MTLPIGLRVTGAISGHDGTVVDGKFEPGALVAQAKGRIAVKWDLNAAISWVYEKNLRYTLPIDWTKPIELDDGTPLVMIDGEEPNEHTIGVQLTGSAASPHPAFPIEGSRGSARRDTGLLLSNSKFHVRNRIMKLIDVTKPLGYSKVDSVPFITMTSEGHILVGRGANGVGSSVEWAIFTKEGKFVRSSNGQGSGLTLRNISKEEVFFYRISNVSNPQGRILPGLFETSQEARGSHPDRQVLRTVVEDGKIISVEIV